MIIEMCDDMFWLSHGFQGCQTYRFIASQQDNFPQNEKYHQKLSQINTFSPAAIRSVQKKVGKNDRHRYVRNKELFNYYISQWLFHFQIPSRSNKSIHYYHHQFFIFNQPYAFESENLSLDCVSLAAVCFMISSCPVT